MSYIDKNLLPNETILYKSKEHRIVLLMSILTLSTGIFLLINFLGTQSSVFAIFGYLFFFSGIYKILQYNYTEFTITNKRVISKKGLIARKIVELQNVKIEGVNINQGILDRIVDSGTISVTGIGGLENIFKNVKSPMKFREIIYSQLDN